MTGSVEFTAQSYLCEETIINSNEGMKWMLQG